MRDKLNIQDVTTGEDAAVRGRKDEDGAYPVIVKVADGAGGYEVWDKTVTVDVLEVAGDLYVKLDDVEQYLLDQRQQYAFVGHKTDGTDVYVGYQDKDGKWYIAKYDLSSDSEVTFAYGASSMPARADWASQSFGTFEDTF